MRKKVSLIGMLFILSFAVIMMTGCVSIWQSGSTSIFRDGIKTVQVIGNGNVSSIKTGKVTERVYLGFISLSGGSVYPSIADTAKAGGITKIATVEYYVKSGFLWLWVDYTTIVTGQ
jgi:hypothetical protein